jgi:hypothetical protein
MSQREIEIPHFETGSYSERAAQFFSQDHEWQESQNIHWHERTVTWAHHPYRYWLMQSAEPASVSSEQSPLLHRMFHVALMSATRTLDNRREFEKWYIVNNGNDPERVVHMQHLIGSTVEEKETGEFLRNFNFILENGLFVPNDEELVKLDQILLMGYMDGFDPVSKLR